MNLKSTVSQLEAYQDQHRISRRGSAAALVAVHIKAVWALDVVEHDGLATHRLEGTDGAVHSSWKEVLGLVEDLNTRTIITRLAHNCCLTMS